MSPCGCVDPSLLMMRSNKSLLCIFFGSGFRRVCLRDWHIQLVPHTGFDLYLSWGIGMLLLKHNMCYDLLTSCGCTTCFTLLLKLLPIEIVIPSSHINTTTKLYRLRNMEDTKNKRLQALRNSGAEKIFEAYKWVNEHRHEFNKEVYGPVLLEVCRFDD